MVERLEKNSFLQCAKHSHIVNGVKGDANIYVKLFLVLNKAPSHTHTHKGMEAQLHAFLTSALEQGGWSGLRPYHSNLQDKPLYPLSI